MIRGNKAIANFPLCIQQNHDVLANCARYSVKRVLFKVGLSWKFNLNWGPYDLLMISH